MRIENAILIVGAFSVALPELDSDAVVRVWQVPMEYRENGLFVAVNLPGQPEEIPACDSKLTVYLGELDYAASETEQLQAAKRRKLAAASAVCDAELAKLSETYPAGEIQSWPQQVKEADAITADPSTTAPLLSTIAAQRGISLIDLAGRVHAKTGAYAEISGVLIGRRQAMEDQINAADSMAKLEEIAW